MASWEFPAEGPVQAEISLPAGSVHVTGTETDTVTVSLEAASGAGERLLASTEVSFDGGKLRVITPRRVTVFGNASLNLEVTMPAGSAVSAETASADITCTGELGGLGGKTASGDVDAERVTGDVDFSTASGDVRLDKSDGDVRVSTASGDLAIGEAAGEIIAKTASGDVRITEAGQSATVKTASGDVRIERISTGLPDATTVSGDIVIAVARDVGVYLDVSTLSGDADSELDSSGGAEGDARLTISCRSVSGDVRIARAAR
jgi:DUF4097 and DUF4098 domain-containing protein YvlB